MAAPVANGSPSTSDASPRLVAIATSAGGLAALSRVVAALPGDFPAAILVVQHLQPTQPSYLASILSRRTPLRVVQASDGERLEAHTIYVAPPDKHLLVTEDGNVLLSSSTKVHFTRPSADRLFQSVASNYGARAIAVVLTGAGTDGANGALAVKGCGGVVIAQDGAAEFPSMPLAAIGTGAVDFVLPLDEIAPMLVRLVAAGVPR